MKMDNVSPWIEASQSTFTLIVCVNSQSDLTLICERSEMNELRLFCSELISWLAEKTLGDPGWVSYTVLELCSFFGMIDTINLVQG